MRTTSFSLLLVLATVCFVTSSQAINLYIGGSAGLAFPTGDFEGSDIENQQGAAERGTAVQAEIGLNTDFSDLYIGIREDNFPANPVYNGFDIDGDWKAERLMYGARLHFSAMTKTRVDPLVGIALTYGPTEASADAAYQGSRVGDEQHLGSVPGLMFEGGTVFDIGKGVRGIVTLQYHTFVAELEDYEFESWWGSPITLDADDVDVTYIVLNLGLRFKVL